MLGFGGSNNANQNGSLMPNGIGGGPSQAQTQLFAQAAQDSGLADAGMNMVNQATGGQSLENEDQVKLLYQLMAAHPNQVALFFLHYPDFMGELANLIGLVVRKEVFGVLQGDLFPTLRVNPESADFAALSGITQDSIDAQVAKVAPVQQMQMEVNQADMQAMNIMNGHQQHHMMNQQQQYQQQQYQQQQQQQQMPQRGLGTALSGFGSSLIRGSLGLPPAQQQQPMGQYPQRM